MPFSKLLNSDIKLDTLTLQRSIILFINAFLVKCSSKTPFNFLTF